MKNSEKTIEVKLERSIAAPPATVFAAWLNPKIPGTPWHEGEKLILNPKVDGLFYWLISGTAHYGRFTKLERAKKIQHTWISPYTLGKESTVTVTFKTQGKGTLMTLAHTGLPDNDGGRSHKEGWEYFLGKFPDQFGKASGKQK